jgi:hypothetical protein
MHRRDILKLFGVGATVVPVIGSAPEMSAQARLIEVPKVELVDAPVTGPMPRNSPHAVTALVILSCPAWEGLASLTEGKLSEMEGPGTHINWRSAVTDESVTFKLSSVYRAAIISADMVSRWRP